ncbi:MAG: phytoene desaturase family protein, partial [Saprospiraceae bacterium]
MTKKIAVIGAGYAGMTAAALLSKYGYQVSVFEKNSTPGGRACLLEKNGFKFDKGPSFYWMPDIFERFFNHFGKSSSDYYSLSRLNPSYKVFWNDHSPTSLPSDLNACKSLFESIEAGAGQKLELFLQEAKVKYDVGMGDFVYLPSLSFAEYLDWRLIKEAVKLDLFTSISKHIKKYFNHPILIQLLEFPILFLGAKPKDTPALYSMMNYADLVLGTWYPMGGMYEVSKAIYQVGIEQGVEYHFNSEINSIQSLEHDRLALLIKGKSNLEFDLVVGAGDYHHIETKLLAEKDRSLPENYWSKKVLAPSALLYFLGFDTIIPNLEHHTLFFDAPFDEHAAQIYDTPGWPDIPLFYTNSSSLSDPQSAPAGHHNMVVLIPVSTELVDTDDIKAKYLDIVLQRLQKHTGIDCKNHLILQESYAQRNFISDYHSFKGNA